jgi:hypothetical protein
MVRHWGFGRGRGLRRARRLNRDRPHLEVVTVHLQDGGVDAFTPDPITIDCRDCACRNTATCDDCVVTFILDREPDDALVVDAEEHRTLRSLHAVGLLPGLRHVPRTG